MKKPTLTRRFPPDKLTWEATVELLEIAFGRRGTQISAPPLENLTFSNPPTQAECEALYQYVNRQRAVIVALVERLSDA